MNPSKGMKSFMAPTISSKITETSPRKKVLVEKKDSLKSHGISVEGVMVEEISPKSEMGFDLEEISGRNRPRSLDFSSSMSQYQSAYTHSPSCFGSEEMSGDNRSRKLDFSRSKSYHQSTPTHTPSCCLDDAPLDADPSLPPYDPITNYLLPRPQFLHYKPRIELNPEFMEDLLNEGDGGLLEDSFSDSEGSVDFSGYTVEEQSSPLKKESDHEPFPTKTREARPDETHVSELRPETYKPITMSFQRPKLIPFLLFFSTVSSCVLLTDSPILHPFVMKDQYFAGPSTLFFGVLHDIRLTDYLAVATRMRQWPIHTIASLPSSSSFSTQEDTSHSVNMTLSSSMIENIGSDFCCRSELELAGNKEKIDGQIELMLRRLYLPLDNMNNEFEHDNTAGEALEIYSRGDAEKIIFEHSEDANKKGTGEEIVWNKYEEGLNSFTDPVVQFGTMIKYDQTDKIGVSVSEKINREDYSLGFKLEQMLEKQVLIEPGQHDINSSVDAVESQMISKEDANGDGTRDEMMVWKGKDVNFPKWGILNSLTDSVIELGTTNKNNQPEGIDMVISEKLDKEGYIVGFGEGRKLDEQVLIELGQEVKHPRKKEIVDAFADPVIESQMMNQNDVGTVLFNSLTGKQPSIFADIMLMLAALIIFSAAALATTLAFLFMKQKQSPVASKDKCRNNRIGSVFGASNGSSYVKLTGGMEVVGDSGPTEMSSIFDNSKQRRKIRGQEVTPSHEIMHRESGVSSSISFGSFTTFEKISAKKGNKAEEVITPVRRSSRVRKQITSP